MRATVANRTFAAACIATATTMKRYEETKYCRGSEEAHGSSNMPFVVHAPVSGYGRLRIGSKMLD
jgi:hypothetical protein